MSIANKPTGFKSDVIASVFNDFLLRLRQDSALPSGVVKHLEELVETDELTADKIKAAVFSEEQL